MKHEFSTIDAYIDNFDVDTQNKLKQLRQIIRDAVPLETKEKISYAMPTFWLNGNIIHFAKFKNHIGLYPGSKAIEVFEERLRKFKTSKGAIQIPVELALPVELIQDIVHYNCKQLLTKTTPK